MKNLYENIGEYTSDNLIAGDNVPILTAGITLASGQGILKRGTVIGIVTETGKATVVDKLKEDGSNIPYGILTDDVDTIDEITTTAYISGLFNKNALILNESDDIKNYEVKLRELGIFIKNVL